MRRKHFASYYFWKHSILILLKFSILSHLFGGSGPTIEYFPAISLVVVNLQPNTFQSSLWWHCRICQVAIWALHYPHQSRRTPFYLARSSEFSMSSECLCFLRLNFQTSTGDITHADLFRNGNTKKQRLAARGNIFANTDLQQFLVLAFQHLHVLPLLFESSVINWSTSGRPALRLYLDSRFQKRKHYCFVYLTRKPNFLPGHACKSTCNYMYVRILKM